MEPMEPMNALLLGLGLVLALTAGTWWSLHRPLERLLVELCGATHRARFWVRHFGAALTLGVLFFTLWALPSASATTVSWVELAYMTRAGLFGLLAGLAVLAFVLFLQQARFERTQAPGTRPVPSPAAFSEGAAFKEGGGETLSAQDGCRADEPRETGP